MIFWDSSAMLPLYLDEAHSGQIQGIARQDPAMVVWWGTLVECLAAFARLRRTNVIDRSQEDELREWVKRMSESWIEIEPAAEIRAISSRLLLIHPLSSGDALQLAAALFWIGDTPQGQPFACLDEKLALAARLEGFSVVPD
jgi:uncharacterized protein